MTENKLYKAHTAILLASVMILVGVVLCVTPLSSAQQTSLGTFEQKECVNLIQLCADCSYNNITSIAYPNSTIEIIDAEMTKRGTEYNYTFCNTSQLGSYLVNGFGDLSGIDTVWAYDFEITYTGKEKINVGEGLSLFSSIIVMLVIGIFFLYLSSKFEGPAGKIILVGLSGIVFFVSILYSLVILTQNFGGFSAFTEGYANFWMVMRIIISIVLTFFGLYCILIVIRWWNIKRGLADID